MGAVGTIQNQFGVFDGSDHPNELTCPSNSQAYGHNECAEAYTNTSELHGEFSFDPAPLPLLQDVV